MINLQQTKRRKLCQELQSSAKKKVGKLTEIVKKTYEIPELLNCNKCGSTMECDHGVYTCLYCKNQILATDYVENLLKENAEIDKTDNAKIDI